MNQNLQKELGRILRILKDKYSPEKIILYGSMANGSAKPGSDLDMVVVKKTKRRFFNRIGDVLKLVRPKEAIDILVYTPKEFRQMSKRSWFIGEEVIKKGKIIYALP
jgi:predicted nucleotidyltransferase